MTASVNITDIASRDLKSRESARRVKGVIDELVERMGADVVEVDYGRGEFSTRCFMDEFYNLFLSPVALEMGIGSIEMKNDDLVLTYEGW